MIFEPGNMNATRQSAVGTPAEIIIMVEEGQRDAAGGRGRGTLATRTKEQEFRSMNKASGRVERREHDTEEGKGASRRRLVSELPRSPFPFLPSSALAYGMPTNCDSVSAVLAQKNRVWKPNVMSL